MGAAMIGDLEKDILTGTITKTAISKLKVATIREELRKRGLDDKGLKGDLVVRFYEAALAPPEQPPTPLPKQEKAPREQLEQQHEEEARSNRVSSKSTTRASEGRGGRKGNRREAGRKGSQRHAERDNSNSTGMEIVFLGTSSGSPTPTRNVTSIAFRLEKTTYLFDCGEGTQRQLHKAGVRPSRISKIFITHLHGDHCFGIAGAICAISNSRRDLASKSGRADESALHIYGPPGIFQLVRVQLEVSQTHVAMPVVVHELVSNGPGDGSSTRPQTVGDQGNRRGRSQIYYSKVTSKTEQPDRHSLLVRGGGTGRPVVKFGVVRGREGEGKWPLVEDEDGVCVHAAHLEHKVECFGYAIQERDSPGMLQPDRCKALGLPAGKAYAQLKEGLAVTAPNGRVIQPDEVVGPPRPGRRAIILGDTCDPWMITSSAMQADVIVHEATFHEGHRNMAVKAGHSTAHMAGLFAHNIQASALILTHFSARYDGYQDAAEEEDSFLPQKALKDFDFSIDGLVQEARHAFHGKKVMAAHDFFRYQIPRREAPQLVARAGSSEESHLE
ncbi:hypothetical protein CYMTET_37777 [Cymbomonas tetramitiformis]|uniref:SAP domain-containing protein n=1 Tax=Cymbomonas tetramitiformis TaxID=36881 RepID=A0AAE0F5M2_9CHLO|nr:hypothetical protein CYMTET_37777 [Cymbomonas tetramitiformis]